MLVVMSVAATDEEVHSVREHIEADGLTPGAHDGMGVVQVRGHTATLVRNHELGGPGTPFGPPSIRYDNRGRGGTNGHSECPLHAVYQSHV